MEKPIVVVNGLVRKDMISALQEECEVRQWTKPEKMPREILKEWLADAEGFIPVMTPVDEDLIAAAPKLKVVAQAAIGYDNIDIDALTKRHIPYGNTPHVVTESVAELAMGLVVCASRRIMENALFVKEGRWMERPSNIKGYDLSRMTMGIIGFGAIGISLSRRARAFGMRIIYHNRHPREDDRLYMATYKSLDELFEEADVVVCALPLTKETEHMIGADAFKRMKKSAIFVNVGRGKVVDTEALAKALEEGDIDYAALDVVDPEPLSPEHPLLQTGKCLLVPHIGTYTNRTRKDMAMLTVRNILAGVKEEPLPACVNEEVNYRNK